MEMKTILGETTEYEKKVAVEKKKVKSWLKIISAFSNGTGGLLIFGIDDEDHIVGLDHVKEDSEFVSRKIKERLDPVPQVKMKIVNEEKKNLLLVEVPAGRDTPYYYTGDAVMVAYCRIGNESVVVNANDMKRLVLRGRNSSYDSLISEYDFDNYAFTKLRERFTVWTGNRFEEKLYESFGIKSGNKLTIAGALLADESPITYSRVFCTRWNGLDKSGGVMDARDSAEYSGSLISLLQEGVSFIKRNMKVMWKKTETSRIEMPDYIERSFFEILVNSLVHRDYLVNGSEVHIDIFDDRLTIYSPGGMPNGEFIQNSSIKDTPSIRRNPVLADIFHRLGYMERQGSGLNKIMEGYRHAVNYSLEKEPIFYSNNS